VLPPFPTMQRVIPAAVAVELRRVACLPSPWLVADMDSTLIRKVRCCFLRVL